MAQIDYQAVLSDLERQQKLMNERFDGAIAAIKQIIALGGASAPGKQGVLAGLGTPPRPSNPLTDGPYAGLSVVDAARLHIRRVGAPVPNIVLAKALEDGGFEHESKNFPNTLNSILHRRSKNVGDVRKVGNAWALGSPA